MLMMGEVKEKDCQAFRLTRLNFILEREEKVKSFIRYNISSYDMYTFWLNDNVAEETNI